MIRALAILAALALPGLDSAPAVVTITGVNGETRIPVQADATGAPVFAAPGLMSALAGDGFRPLRLSPPSPSFQDPEPLTHPKWWPILCLGNPE